MPGLKNIVLYFWKKFVSMLY